MASTRSNAWPGIILILIGILLLLPRFTSFHLHTLWPFIVLATGIGFVAGFLGNRSNVGLLMPGAIFIVAGLVFLYCAAEGWYAMRTLWPYFILAPGLGFVLMYLLGPKEHGLLIPGGILLAIGAFFLLRRTNLDYLWPVLLIGLGIVLLLTSRK